MKVLGVSLVIAVFALCLVMMNTHPISAQNPSEGSSRPEVNQAVHFDVSPPLRDLVRENPIQPRYGFHQAEPVLRPKLMHLIESAGHGSAMDGALQKLILPKVSAVAGLNLLGVGVGFDNYQVPDAPTDVNLAVGTTQVVEWVNVSYAVFNKTTGAVELGPIEGNQLWSGFGGQCQNNNDGDIIAQWDKMAQRWVLTQNVFSPPYFTCVAVSKTTDATGAYFRYAFPQPGFPDYPKWGIWPDGYYQANNNFGTGSFVGARPCAYDRAKMLVGDSSALQICFQTGTFDDSMLPGDLDSAAGPPKGEPEVYVGSIDNGNPNSSNVVYEYLFHVDFANPNDSTFTGGGGTMPITVATFGLGCGGFSACIPQKGVGDVLDSLGDRLMYRLAYINVETAFKSAADHQSWLVSHSVTSPTGQVGERWYEFQSLENNTNLHVNQQGTFAPDSNYRWMGSIAQDKKGDFLLGYSISSSTMFPSINYTGRVPTDPLGTMETEAQMFAGTGSQIDTANRWGDYTSMAIDSQDYCTFWYVNQYYTTTTTFGWSTRLGSFKFPNCN